jgi:diguanylate cyclase (GGDEF)-like protein
MERPSLSVLVCAARQEDARFAARVLSDHGDRAEIAKSVTAALKRLSETSFDVVLVGLSLPRGDGLALVHHLRALHSEVDVLVMAEPEELAESAHAMALGVLATVLLPLTGDGLMVTVDRARERRVLIRERHRLAAEREGSQRRNATYARCAAFVAETDARAVAARVLDACNAEVEATASAVYLPELPASVRYLRAANVGDGDATSGVLDTMDLAHVDPTQTVQWHGDRLRLNAMGGTDLLAIIELVGVQSIDDDTRRALEVIAGLATAAFSAARKVDAIARTGIKDPDTSAYTFAYFGDVAGREIDRAARHGRRFSLLTVSLDGLEDNRRFLSRADMRTLRQSLADALLDAVRDSDVVARVEDDELYVLLPETGLLGALACRRRICARLTSLDVLSGLGDLTPLVGIGVFPSDGRDFGRLLRAARRRTEASRNGVYRRLGLEGVPFWEAVGRLLGSEDDMAVGRDGSIAIHEELREAHDQENLSQHVVMTPQLVAQIGSILTEDAVRRDLAGSLYVAGDEALAGAVARASSEVEHPKLRAWSLGSRVAPAEAVSRIHLPVDDRRLDQGVLLLSLNELGGYGLLARRLGEHTLVAYHAADLDLVDGLTTSLQAEYHLQPEER